MIFSLLGFFKRMQSSTTAGFTRSQLSKKGCNQHGMLAKLDKLHGKSSDNETRQTYHIHQLIPQLIENTAEQSSDALSKYFYKQRKSQLKEKYIYVIG